MVMLGIEAATFESILAGVESIGIVVAVIAGGLWTAFTFGPLRTVSRARAENTRLERLNRQRAVINITLHAEQKTLPDDPAQFISATVNVSNRGTGVTTLNFPNLQPFSATSISFTSDGEVKTGDVLRASSFVPGGLPSSFVTLIPGETNRLTFFIRVNGKGLYLLQFSAAVHQNVIDSVNQEIDAKPGIWHASEYFVVI